MRVRAEIERLAVRRPNRLSRWQLEFSRQFPWRSVRRRDDGEKVCRHAAAIARVVSNPLPVRRPASILARTIIARELLLLTARDGDHPNVVEVAIVRFWGWTRRVADARAVR